LNGKIKIYSKANMLGQNLTLTVVFLLSVLLWLIISNSFVPGEFLLQLPFFRNAFSRIDFFIVKAVFFSLIGIISYVAFLPFSYGREIWFYENSKKTRLAPNRLFEYYSIKKSLRAINILFQVHIRKFFVSLLFLVPSFITAGCIVFSLQSGIGRKMLFVLLLSTILLTISGLFFAFIFKQRYFLATYLCYENEGCKVKEAIKLSTEIMENKCFETAFFKMSFAGWFLLCVFIFPVFYVYPFYRLSISSKAVFLLANIKNNA